jgi:hypothetical protein
MSDFGVQLVCQRLTATGRYAAGSRLDHCERCGHPVTIAPTSVRLLNTKYKGRAVRVVCMECASALPPLPVEDFTEEQRREVREGTPGASEERRRAAERDVVAQLGGKPRDDS